ncbi:hypothetical protein [Polaromonas sp. UBA4122]|uniref:hypothetical protein n=1 Tax=Polaromonas sp. UBA4122 TaxID=1947074 RepID=UPI002600A403|nr:hypothetical protein [Polaromonas sp. UBA4122]
MAPTLVASHTALPHEGAVLVWGGPALRPPAFTAFTYFYTLHSAQASASPEAGRQETPWHA